MGKHPTAKEERFWIFRSGEYVLEIFFEGDRLFTLEGFQLLTTITEYSGNFTKIFSLGGITLDNLLKMFLQGEYFAQDSLLKGGVEIQKNSERDIPLNSLCVTMYG